MEAQEVQLPQTPEEMYKRNVKAIKKARAKYSAGPVRQGFSLALAVLDAVHEGDDAREVWAF